MTNVDPRRLFSLIACSFIVAVSVGCAAEAQPSGGQQGGADAAVCTDLQQLDRGVAKSKSLTAFSSADDVKKARTQLDQGLASMEESVADGSGLDVSALEKEIEKFRIFANRIHPGLTIGQGATALAGPATAIGQELDRLNDEAGCRA